MSLPPEKTERYLELTRVAVQLQQVDLHEDALDMLEKVIKISPWYASAYIVQGLSYQAINQNDAAEEAFRKALKLQPENDQVLKSLGLLLIAQQKYDEGIKYLIKYNKKHPEDNITLDALILAYSSLKKPDEVKKLLLANWSSTNDEEIGIRYTRYLLGLEQNKEALKIATQVVEKHESPRTLTELSLVLVVLELYEDAVVQLEKAIELDPAFDRALRGLSFCFTKLNRVEEAIEYADRALSINDKHYRNLQAKGDALLLMGRFSEALETAQTAIDLIDLKKEPEAEPVLDVLYLQKFNAHLGLNQIDNALEEMQKSRQLLPHEGRFYSYPAELLRGLGEVKKAAQLVEEAKQANVLSAFSVDLLVRILLESENYADLWSLLDPQWDNNLSGFMTGLGYEYYMKDEVKIAKNIFIHVHERLPSDSGIATNLAFIHTGDGEYDQAEKLLLLALKGKDKEDKSLANCNLGYLYLITGKIKEAKKCFAAVIESASDDQEAVVRVGITPSDPSEICCTPHPVQLLPLKLAANANLVAVHLQEDNAKQAEKLAKQIIKSWAEFGITYQVMGSVDRFTGDNPSAVKNWEKALELSTDPAERNMIQEWLSEVEDS